MVRAVPVSSPAWWPALFLCGVLLLQGCSLLPKKESAEENKPVAGLVRSGAAGAGTTGADKDDKKDDGKKAGEKRDAFTVELQRLSIEGIVYQRDGLAGHELAIPHDHHLGILRFIVDD